jgi:amino acid adenylation domain-containing protein
MLLNHFLENSAQRLPEKVALVCRGQRLTYRELDERANRLANYLLAAGVHKQDRVAIWLENSAEAVIAVFAVLKAGAVFCLLNPELKAAKAHHILADSGAWGFVTTGPFWETLQAVREDLADLKCVLLHNAQFTVSRQGPQLAGWDQVQNDFPASRPPAGSITVDLAALIYTSSTTGPAKGVMLTHLNMTTAAASITQYLRNVEEDVILSVLPLAFDYGLYQVLMAFRMGATLILEKSFLYPYPVIDLLVKERVTGFPVVPTIVSLLMQLKNLDQYAFPALRYITNTAQAISPRQIQELQRIFPQALIFSMYGLTECKRVSYLPPEEIAHRPTSVGKAMPNTETYLVDEAGRRLTTPGQIGELVVRGAHVMQGYWHLPEATAARLKPGYNAWEKHLYTGDLFKQDEEGFLYFIARKDDLIKTAGELVSPKEVEDILYEFPNLIEAAVVGKPDEVLGQAVCAYIVLREGAQAGEQDLAGFCKSRMERFMVPKWFKIMPALPKTPTGKISKQQLPI